MASGSVFSKTLQTITITKLDELSKQNTTFSERYDALVEAFQAEIDPLERLQMLSDGTKQCMGVKTGAARKDGRPGKVIAGSTHNSNLEADLQNLDQFLEQAAFDPSISHEFLQGWENKLLHYLSIQATKLRYADLYGKLVSEWLDPGNRSNADSSDDNVKIENSFEELPGHNKMKAQSEWESLVFEPADVDAAAMEDYLDRLFSPSKPHVASAIHRLDGEVQKFEESLARPSQFNADSLQWTIKGLMSSDLLSNQKREVVGDFLNNEMILAEIADVLNMRMEALDRWSWGDYVRVEQRRKVNGGFSVHMDEDILTAIFLHYIGTQWSVFFRRTLKDIIYKSDVWKSSRTEIPELDRMRRRYFLGNSFLQTNSSLQSKRIGIHMNEYFMYRLLATLEQKIEVGDGEVEADFKAPPGNLPRGMSFGAAMAAEYSDDVEMGFALMDNAPCVEDLEKTPPPSKKPMDAKQKLLHLFSTEAIINRRMNGGLTCFRTIFEPWNSLLPHASILAVLEMFGVSKKWRTFFQTFLQAPLKTDGEGDSEPRLRQRGIPESHVLSDCLGELVLFCLDFSVNQSTDGQVLHRVYDDVWFWNKDYEKCAKAWACVLEFSRVMGVKVDDTKTGSVRIDKDSEIPIDNRLPVGLIQWGFLYMDPSTGSFKINQEMVDSHAMELRQQLEGKCKSIIDWIQAWNTYAGTFFSSNFGKAANCFGREHVDDILATHRRIQEIVFDGGNVTQHLRTMISDRFGVTDLPDGFFFFPVRLGGLELSSPFVDLIQMRGSVNEDVYHQVDKFLDDEQKAYNKARRDFYREDTRQRHRRECPDFTPDDPDTFFSYEEYARYREDFIATANADMCAMYANLLSPPEQHVTECTAEIRLALEQLQGTYPKEQMYWELLSAYWQHIYSAYGPQMTQKFGGLHVVEPGWLPIGMVKQLRERKTTWKD